MDVKKIGIKDKNLFYTYYWAKTKGFVSIEKLLGDVEQICEKSGAIVQLLDPRFLLAPVLLDRAVLLAFSAKTHGYIYARDLGIEVLRYLSAQHQIVEAKKMFGVDENTQTICILVMSEKEGVISLVKSLLGKLVEETPPPKRETPLETILTRYGLKRDDLSSVRAKSEEEAAVLLVGEKMALLAVER